jgi:hypothetical protein
MSRVPTVRVYSKEVGGDEVITINEADFDPKIHRHVDDEPSGAGKGSELKGKLPEDFPGRKELEAFDPPIRTYAQLRRALEADVKVPGIGDITKQQIIERLGAVQPSEEEGE